MSALLSVPRELATHKAKLGSPRGEMSLEDDARGCLKRAIEALVALQQPEGWWKGELETNVTMDAEDLLLREFLGIRTPEQTASAARWIRSCQREDGTWANFYAGPPELSTTVEAYVALRLAGDEPDARAHEARPRRSSRPPAASSATRVFTRIWLALFGLWSWDELPVLPAELMFLPRFDPAQHLRLRVLGAPDRGRSHDRERPPAVPQDRLRHR